MRLLDCFVEVIAYTLYFKKSAATKQAQFETVRMDLQRVLSQSEICLKKDLFSKEEYDMARFAVCAWVDETILASQWREKDKWQREQLQRVYYNTTDAGEEFFERLNMLGLHQRDVREVYYLCMAMGFMGRYIHQGDECLLSQVKSSNLKILIGGSLGVPVLDRVELFPNAYPPESSQQITTMRKRRFPIKQGILILAALSPLILYGLLYWVYRFVLNGIGDNFFRAVS